MRCEQSRGHHNQVWEFNYWYHASRECEKYVLLFSNSCDECTASWCCCPHEFWLKKWFRHFDRFFVSFVELSVSSEMCRKRWALFDGVRMIDAVFCRVMLFIESVWFGERRCFMSGRLTQTWVFAWTHVRVQRTTYLWSDRKTPLSRNQSHVNVR